MNLQISKTKQQEQFSIAYIRAIAASDGYALEEITVDKDSIDCSITQRGNGNEFPQIESLMTTKNHNKPQHIKSIKLVS